MKRIDEDGFIVTEDDRYMLMLKVQPISFALKSPQEQRNIWQTFREWMVMIPNPVRFRVQSHPYNLNEYFHDVRANSHTQGRIPLYIMPKDSLDRYVIEQVVYSLSQTILIRILDPHVTHAEVATMLADTEEHQLNTPNASKGHVITLAGRDESPTRET